MFTKLLQKYDSISFFSLIRHFHTKTESYFQIWRKLGVCVCINYMKWHTTKKTELKVTFYVRLNMVKKWRFFTNFSQADQGSHPHFLCNLLSLFSHSLFLFFLSLSHTHTFTLTHFYFLLYKLTNVVNFIKLTRFKKHRLWFIDVKQASF